ncbi:hypothetical protein [Ensifer sp. SL37]|uniref:hypothetical protein n=1 Tax=Ensifer sp. SL37 TaxID=2995137 RepID=UPI0022744F18|nr:hypothetical protein [Ensifer sp. SL37]MCY1741463.1 hypothetical protein [Ensifer sp. SL37]
MFGMIAPETALLILITLVAVLILVVTDVSGRLNAQAKAINAMSEKMETQQEAISEFAILKLEVIDPLERFMDRHDPTLRRIQKDRDRQELIDEWNESGHWPNNPEEILKQYD